MTTAVPVCGQVVTTNLWSLQVGFYSDSTPALDTHGNIYVSTWAGHVLAVMDRTSFTTLKQTPDLSLEFVHEFHQRRNKNLFLLKIRLAAAADDRQSGPSRTGVALRSGSTE